MKCHCIILQIKWIYRVYVEFYINLHNTNKIKTGHVSEIRVSTVRVPYHQYAILNSQYFQISIIHGTSLLNYQTSNTVNTNTFIYSILHQTTLHADTSWRQMFFFSNTIGQLEERENKVYTFFIKNIFRSLFYKKLAGCLF